MLILILYEEIIVYLHLQKSYSAYRYLIMMVSKFKRLYYFLLIHYKLKKRKEPLKNGHQQKLIGEIRLSHFLISSYTSNSVMID